MAGCVTTLWTTRVQPRGGWTISSFPSDFSSISVPNSWRFGGWTKSTTTHFNKANTEIYPHHHNNQLSTPLTHSEHQPHNNQTRPTKFSSLPPMTKTLQSLPISKTQHRITHRPTNPVPFFLAPVFLISRSSNSNLVLIHIAIHKPNTQITHF